MACLPGAPRSARRQGREASAPPLPPALCARQLICPRPVSCPFRPPPHRTAPPPSPNTTPTAPHRPVLSRAPALASLSSPPCLTLACRVPGPLRLIWAGPPIYPRVNQQPACLPPDLLSTCPAPLGHRHLGPPEHPPAPGPCCLGTRPTLSPRRPASFSAAPPHLPAPPPAGERTPGPARSRRHTWAGPPSAPVLRPCVEGRVSSRTPPPLPPSFTPGVNRPPRHRPARDVPSVRRSAAKRPSPLPALVGPFTPTP